MSRSIFSLSFTITLLFVTCVSRSELVAKTDPMLDRIYRAICANQTEAAKADLAALLSGNPDYIQARMLKLYFKEEQQEALNKAKQLRGDFSHLSDVDRIIIADALMISRSLNFSKVRSLLEFKAKDPVVERYRLSSEGNFDFIEGKEGDGFEKLSLALNKENLLEPPVLSTLLSYGIRSDQLKDRLYSLLPLVESFPEGEPEKYSLMAFAELVRSGWENQGLIAEYSRKAYEQCPNDPQFALDYAFYLHSAKETRKAKEIALGVVSSRYYYSPYFDLILAETYLGENDLINFRKYLDRAKASLPYFDQIEKENIKRMDETAGSDEKSRWWFFGGVVFLGLLTLFALYKSRRTPDQDAARGRIRS